MQTTLIESSREAASLERRIKVRRFGTALVRPWRNESYAVGGAEVVGAAGVTAAAGLVTLTRSFNSLLGLKNGIFFAGTSTRAPVLELRPTRGLRWRVRKLPKPRISILSPARSERTTLSKIVSTITSLSFRVSSAKRETSSIRSAFVMVSALLTFLSTAGPGFRLRNTALHLLPKIVEANVRFQ